MANICVLVTVSPWWDQRQVYKQVRDWSKADMM